MINKVGEFIYEVPSDSDAGKVYLVDVTPGRDVTCTCTAYAIKRNKVGAGKPNAYPTEVRGRTQNGFCKHIPYVLAESSVEEADSAAEFERIRIVESLKQTARELDS